MAMQIVLLVLGIVVLVIGGTVIAAWRSDRPAEPERDENDRPIGR